MLKNLVLNGQVKVKGPWKEKTKNGQVYMSAYLENGMRVDVIKSKNNGNTNDPDYEILFVQSGDNSKAPRNGQNSNGQKNQQQNRPSQPQKPQPKQEQEQKQKQQQDAEEELFWKNLEDDELPFDH